MANGIEANQVEVVGFRWGVLSDKGKEREENEDSYWIEAEEGLFVVSDGMGGHRGGELASRIVTEDLPVIIENALGRLRRGSPGSVRRVFKRAVVEQSRQLRMEGVSETGYKGMGATLVVVLLRQGRVYVGNLGDSRVYRLRRGKLRQLSRDHTVVRELVEKGKIEPAEAEGHEAEGQITHYVGMEEEEAVPFVRSLAVRRGDRLLLCTDGLTDMLEEKVILEILRIEEDCQAACERLVKSANAAGGHDNITVVVIEKL
jgi:serine/threonine protein phosphatase PrpC